MDKHVNVFSSRVQLSLATTVKHEKKYVSISEESRFEGNTTFGGTLNLRVFVPLQNKEKIAHNFFQLKANFKTTI